MSRLFPFLLAAGAALQSSAAQPEDIATMVARELQAQGRRVERTYSDPLGDRVSIDYEGEPVTYNGWTIAPRLSCISAMCGDGTGIDRFDSLQHSITDPSGRIELSIEDHGADGFAPKMEGLLLDGITIHDRRSGEPLTATFEISGRDIYIRIDTNGGTYRESPRTLLSAIPLLDAKYRGMLAWLRDPAGEPPLNIESTTRKLTEWLDETRVHYGLPPRGS